MDYIISAGGKVGLPYLNIVMIYHVQEDTWTIKNNFPHTVFSGIGYVLDKSRFFVQGGRTDAVGEVEMSIREYDLENDAWIQGFRLNKAHLDGFAIVYNN